MIRITFWTALFLVLLRVCIGWHFAYEGYGKVKSAYLGKAAANEKPFSSETYFRESESWLGRKLKPMLLGDPDAELVAKLTPKDDADAKTLDRFPDALAPEWDGYFAAFKSHYRLTDEQAAESQKRFDVQKEAYVKWALGNGGIDPDTKQIKQITLKVKRKAPGNNPGGDFDEQVTVATRGRELLKKAADVKAAYAKFLELGKDVDGAGLRTVKGDVAAIRAELQKELDDQTKKMKDDLAAPLDARVSAFPPLPGDKDAAAQSAALKEMLTPMADGKNPLAARWDEYAAYVKDFSPNLSDDQKGDVDARVAAAKQRFDRWLAGKDMFTGEPLPRNDVAEWKAAYTAVETPDADPKKAPQVEAERKLLASRLQGDLKGFTDALKTEIGKSLGEDRAKGYAPAVTEQYFGFIPKWKPIEYMDWTTRWFLAVVGVTLMVGLFTRSSCFLAAGFLAMTNLIQPSVPWLPTAPNNEGNYLFVNKNMIEMVALLALMTTRSGLWAGLDAIIAFVFGRRKPAPVQVVEQRRMRL